MAQVRVGFNQAVLTWQRFEPNATLPATVTRVAERSNEPAGHTTIGFVSTTGLPFTDDVLIGHVVFMLNPSFAHGPGSTSVTVQTNHAVASIGAQELNTASSFVAENLTINFTNTPDAPSLFTIANISHEYVPNFVRAGNVWTADTVVPFDVGTIATDAFNIVRSPGSTIAFQNITDGQVALNAGTEETVTEVTFIITSPDGQNSATHTIIIRRAGGNDNTEIETFSVVVRGGAITGAWENLVWTATQNILYINRNYVAINVVPVSATATVSIRHAGETFASGELIDNLIVGMNTVQVVVTPQIGAYVTRSVRLNVLALGDTPAPPGDDDDDDDEDEDERNMILRTIVFILIGLLILIILFAVLKSIQRDEEERKKEKPPQSPPTTPTETPPPQTNAPLQMDTSYTQSGAPIHQPAQTPQTQPPITF